MHLPSAVLWRCWKDSMSRPREGLDPRGREASSPSAGTPVSLAASESLVKQGARSPDQNPARPPAQLPTPLSTVPFQSACGEHVFLSASTYGTACRPDSPERLVLVASLLPSQRRPLWGPLRLPTRIIPVRRPASPPVGSLPPAAPPVPGNLAYC